MVDLPDRSELAAAAAASLKANFVAELASLAAAQAAAQVVPHRPCFDSCIASSSSADVGSVAAS